MRVSVKKTILSIFTGVIISVITPVFCFADDTIIPGVYAENIPLGGMNANQATATINGYVDEMMGKTITLYTVNDNEVEISPADIGFKWANPEIVEDALKIGRTGNIVSRYKEKKDLEYSNKIYGIIFSVDENLVRQLLEERCSVFDQKAKNGTVSFSNGTFDFSEGQMGLMLDVDASVASLKNFMENEWSGQNSTFSLIIMADTPAGSAEDMALVKDVLGTFHTSFKTSSAARSSNVSNGARLINGSVLYPGEEFSFTEHVTPFSLDNGYQVAASYASGKVVDSVGGGICQVSSTLYNAVLLSELNVTQRRNHGMIVTYVKPAMDATIAESAGTDFRFSNNTDAPIYIEAYTTDEKELYVNIYGHETRPADRTVTYESEVVQTIQPGPDVIVEDSSQPIGYISSQSAHVGYKANCWKVVTQNGETTRELVNTSTYNMAPKYVTVGTGTNDPAAAAALKQAIESGDTGNIKSTASSLKSAAENGTPVELDQEAALAMYEAALKEQEAASAEQAAQE